jgi:hypothetical protein
VVQRVLSAWAMLEPIAAARKNDSKRGRKAGAG